MQRRVQGGNGGILQAIRAGKLTTVQRGAHRMWTLNCLLPCRAKKLISGSVELSIVSAPNQVNPASARYLNITDGPVCLVSSFPL